MTQVLKSFSKAGFVPSMNFIMKCIALKQTFAYLLSGNLSTEIKSRMALTKVFLSTNQESKTN